MPTSQPSPVPAPRSRRISLAWVLLAYLVAAATGGAAAWLLRGEHPLWVLAVADAVATVTVFGFSMALDNSSVYDPYWSVFPIPAALYLAGVGLGTAPALRQGLVLALVALWGCRLTWNWIRGWPGLHHEDWRYVDIRTKAGKAYPLASFVAIHALPTAWVYGGLLSAWVALAAGSRPLGWLDGVAACVTLGAILIEALSDRQLARFRARRPPPDAILEEGLWRYSRHPNYFGEVTFWWGLYLFALAADPGRWWVVVGPLAMTGLFVFISIPLIERRMRARRPAYAQRQRRVSALVPWFPKRDGSG